MHTTLPMRSVLLAIALCASVGGVAEAQVSSLADGSTLTFTQKLFLHENNSQAPNLPITQPTSQQHYFNYAHCVCSSPGVTPTTQPWYENTFAWQIELNNPVTPQHIPLEIWVGDSCSADAVTRSMQCHQITTAGISDISTMTSSGGGFAQPEVPVFDLMEPVPGTTECNQQVLAANEWILVSSMNSGVPDYFVSQEIDTDSLPPPVPTVFQAEGAESAINLSWTAAIGNVSDIAYYQALCADPEGNPVTTSPLAPRYITPRTLCGASTDACLTAVTPSSPRPPIVNIDAGVDAGADAGVPQTCTTPPASFPAGLAQLDPAFICGEVTQATATSMRIEGLNDNVPYTVELLAIDLAGNAAGVYFTSTLTPKPVTDFWEDIHDRGGDVKGGLCLIAETFGDDNPLTGMMRSFRDDTLGQTAYGRWLSEVYYGSIGKLGAVVHGHIALRIIAGVFLLPLIALALLWHLFTLPGLVILFALVALRRRKILRTRLVRAAATAAIALCVLAPTVARAQGTPYWDNAPDSDINSPPLATADQESVVKWHVSVAVGPYTPQIDKQLGLTPGPYKAMFGGYAIMPQITLDRVLLRKYGQFGIGASIGYMSKSAHPYEDMTDPSDPNRPRSSGDTNSFTLIPTALTAFYRFTMLDDDYGIPIVPYARAGLDYYIWWVKAPNGGFAKVCGDGGMEPDCSQNKALGASLGFQGTIGIAIRAERIDKAAAQSMHDGGIEHAGFFGEVELADVNGFGESGKLSVGDTTWFAGVEFEF